MRLPKTLPSLLQIVKTTNVLVEIKEKKGDQKYFFVANAAIVGPRIIATAIIAAAFGRSPVICAR
jgi:hypothetical protein